ncbi:hypothetical protein [Caballeronia cordobensis]|uniref:hypothetical protein n=1 Tax=Caballeronia cordobensis TaxID=1353886 RepID=UPI00045EFD16|nr:uncharacterized protein BRPE67_FCDS01520 [Burkholderia sp. RPE67]
MQFNISKLSLVGVATDVCQRLAQLGLDVGRSHVVEIIAGLLGYGNQRLMRSRTFELDEPLYDFLYLADPHVALLDWNLGGRRIRELSATSALADDARRALLAVCADTLMAWYPKSVFFDGHSFAREHVIPVYTPQIAGSEKVRAVVHETGEPANILVETIDTCFEWSIRRTKEAVWKLCIGGLLGRAGADRSADANLAQVMFWATFEFPKVGPALISAEAYMVVEDACVHYPSEYRLPPRDALFHASGL